MSEHGPAAVDLCSCNDRQVLALPAIIVEVGWVAPDRGSAVDYRGEPGAVAPDPPERPHQDLRVASVDAGGDAQCLEDGVGLSVRIESRLCVYGR